MRIYSELSPNIPKTAKPRIVIVGGGFGGLYLAKKIDTRQFQVVLFDKRNYHTFQPLLYQVATAGLQADAIAGALRTAFKNKADFHFRMLRVQEVNTDQNYVATSAGDVHYDYLVLATGCKSNFFGNANMEKFSLPLKSIPDALNIRSQLMQSLEMASMVTRPALAKKLMSIVIVGGGPTGVETAGALSELRTHILPKDYPTLDFNLMDIHLVQSGHQLLPGMAEKSCDRALHDLQKMGINVILGARVNDYDGNTAILSNGTQIETNTVIWSAGVTGDIVPGLDPAWIDHNRLIVDPHCKVVGSKNIFAIGDISLFKSEKFPDGLPGVAQPAMQMGNYLAKAIPLLHEDKEVKDFNYFDKGSLATIGRGKAVFNTPGRRAFGGFFAWFIWAFVHIAFLVNFKNRVKVFINWIWSYFTYDTGNRLIIRPYIRKDDKIGQKVAQDNEY